MLNIYLVHIRIIYAMYEDKELENIFVEYYEKWNFSLVEKLGLWCKREYGKIFLGEFESI